MVYYSRSTYKHHQYFQQRGRNFAKTIVKAPTRSIHQTKSCWVLVGTTCILFILLRWCVTLFTTSTLLINIHQPSSPYGHLFGFHALKSHQQLPSFSSSSFQSQSSSEQRPTAPVLVTLRNSSRNSSSGYKFAVVVTGLFHRYVFQNSMERFIQPMYRQGHSVDYYVSLSMKQPPAYRSDQTYMNHQVSDPIFNQCIYQEDMQTLRDENYRKTQIHIFLQQQLKDAGGNLQYLTFQDNYASVDTNAKVIQHRTRALQMYPNEDPDLRFPTLDVRDNAQNRTANANRNMLHLFYHIQHLYAHVLAHEMEIRLKKYDYVIFLRDDTMWFNNFDFQSMIDPGNSIPALSSSLVVSEINIELYVPSCDARIPSMHPMEMNDHIAIVKRERADLYGNYFDELFRTDMGRCAQRLNDELRYGRSTTPVRGCNSEMLLKYILETNNVTIQSMGQGKLPFQRMVFVKDPVTSKVNSCFHYFCQSHSDPLIIPPGMKKCTDIT